jgi:hypothetical protein
LLFRNVQTIDTLIETGDSEQIFQKAIQEQGRGQVCWSFVPPLALFFFCLFFLIYSMRGQPNWFWTHNKRWSLLFLQFLNFHPPLLDFKPETFKLNSQVSTAGMSPREDFERGPTNVWCWMFLLQFFWQYCFLGGHVYDLLILPIINTSLCLYSFLLQIFLFFFPWKSLEAFWIVIVNTLPLGSSFA